MTPAFAAVALACATWASTGLGGVAALRYRDRLHLLLGFSAGAVLGVVFFDLMPEVFAVGGTERGLPLGTAAGFLAFFGFERLTALHKSRTHAHAVGDHATEIGVLGAAGLSVHSFLDGIAIGVSVQADTAIGLTVALAIIAHDFNDGLSAVTVMLAHGNPPRRSVLWLLIDMSAPVLGAASTTLLEFPPDVLPWLLAFFTGVFLYIGASDLLPEAREHDSPAVGLATATGMLTMLSITRVLPR